MSSLKLLYMSISPLILMKTIELIIQNLFQYQCVHLNLVDNILMSDSSESSPAKRANRSKSEEKQVVNKLFITNLDGKSDTRELETQLRTLFQKCGAIESITVKRNRNSEYCFAFVDMKEYSAAQKCVEMYDRSTMNGKEIKVEFQDDNKRRKDTKAVTTAERWATLLGNATHPAMTLAPVAINVTNTADLALRTPTAARRKRDITEATVATEVEAVLLNPKKIARTDLVIATKRRRRNIKRADPQILIDHRNISEYGSYGVHAWSIMESGSLNVSSLGVYGA